MTARRAFRRTLVALRNDDQKIEIAVFVRAAPSVRAEEKNFVRRKLRHQAARDLLQQIFGDGFHGENFASRYLNCNLFLESVLHLKPQHARRIRAQYIKPVLFIKRERDS